MGTQASGPGAPPPSSAPVQVFVLDGHELVRQGLRDLLEGAGLEVVGESGSAVEAVRRIPALHPDVAVLGGRLPDGTGIEVCRDVRSADPHVRCLLLTSYDDDQALRAAMLAGASGYVLKQIRSNDLVEGILRAAEGKTLFAPGAGQRVMEGLPEAAVGPGPEKLSPLERETLTLIGQGLTNRQIGEQLVRTEDAVRSCVSSVLVKLGLDYVRRQPSIR